MVKSLSITDYSATKLVKLMKEKELSPVEVVNAYLDRIEKHNSKWNAFVTINERAIEEARKAEELIMKDEGFGKLHGIPVAIKDLTPTKGMVTTYGSPIFKDYIPDCEPTFLKRIRTEGGIILGKTNTPEFGHKGTTDNPLFGVTKNPWNDSLTPGGSSGGSAVAVAAKLAPIAEGSDGGGSIRIPAALTGIFGLKATFGLVPHDGDQKNSFGTQHPFVHNGPMTRTVEDAALLFSVMQGYSANDPSSVPGLDENYQDLSHNMKGLRIAFSPNFGLYEISHDVSKVIHRAAANFRALGCHVEEVDLSLGESIRDLSRAFSGLWCVKMAANYGMLYDQNPESFSKGIARIIEIGRKISAVDYKQIELVRTRVWKEFQRIFNQYDLLISPVTATTAFDHNLQGPDQINGKTVNPATDWTLTQPFNLTGHPAASLPIGLTEAGLPVGLQVAGSRFADKLVLQACHAYETAFQTYIEPSLA